MKTRLIALAIFLSVFAMGINSSSYAQNKSTKKSHNKTMMMDSTKAKSHKMKTSTTTHHKTHKTTKSSHSGMKSKKDTTNYK